MVSFTCKEDYVFYSGGGQKRYFNIGFFQERLFLCRYITSDKMRSTSGRYVETSTAEFLTKYIRKLNIFNNNCRKCSINVFEQQRADMKAICIGYKRGETDFYWGLYIAIYTSHFLTFLLGSKLYTIVQGISHVFKE